MKKKKWNDYFGKIKNKYNLKMNGRSPIVIHLDGKNVTKNWTHDLLDENKNSFNDILEQTLKHITEKFNSIAISGADEVAFIFLDSKKIKSFIGEKRYKTQDVVSIFSQYFYKYFNDRYKKRPVYWHCKSFNIPEGKVKSYIKCRSSIIIESQLTYFLKRKDFKNAGKIPLADKIKMAREMADYNERQKFEKGKLYVNGEQVDLESFLKNEIIKIPTTERKELITFLDINEF